MSSKLKPCASEDTNKKVVRPPTEWEKMLSITHLIRDLNLEYKKKSVRSTIKPQIAWAKDLNRNFLKENIQMASKSRTRCSTSLVILEMQNKTTMSYHFIPIRMAKIRR